MGFIHMADLVGLTGFVGTGPQSTLNPIPVYDGPRVGDAFREWNAAMSGLAGRKGSRWRNAQQGQQGPGGAQPPQQGGDDEDDAMGQVRFVDPPAELDILYSMSDWGDGDASDELSPEASFGLGQQSVPPALGIAQRIIGESIQSIELRSQVTPQVVIDRPFAPGGAAPPQVQGGTPMSRVFMERVAKPAAYIKLAGGAVVPVEPYGKPTEDYTGYMILGTAAVAAVGVFAGVKIGQLLFCPRSAKANQKRK